MMLTGLILTSLIAPQPNILIIHVDDLGWQDTSVRMTSEPENQTSVWRTPNIAKLASEGIVCTNGYASAPVCTPTRVSLMTGQAPARHQTTFWTLQHDRDTSGKHPRLKPPAWNNKGLQPSAALLPEMLRGAGYRTIHVGKAHFGAHGTAGSDPTNLGFDVNVAGHGSGAPSSYLGLHNFSHAGRAGKPNVKRVWDVPGMEEYHGRDIYLTEALTERACEEIDRAAKDETPFFMNFAPYAVHTPVMANKRLLKPYEEMPTKEAAYATMVESVDNAVGNLLNRIDAHGLGDDTIVIFTSDNGGVSGRAGRPPHRNAPLQSGKSAAYEGGTRVPWIVRWPGVTTAGDRTHSPVVTHDLYPTLLSAASLSMPKEHNVDGIDARAIFEGTPQPERTIGWNQPHQVNAQGPGIEPFTSLRHGQWKIIVFHDGPRVELFDLASDIGEENDLSEARPEMLADMLVRLHAWMKQTGAQLSVDQSTGAAVDMSTSDVSPQSEQGSKAGNF